MEYGERLLYREEDAVRLRGLPTYLVDLEILGLLPEAIAALATEILASEHVTTDTRQAQLAGR
jgi:hypothetical protein